MPTPALLGALPPGTYPIGGPIIDISGGLLPADTTLRDAGVLAINDGAWWKVNSKTGDGWQPAASLTDDDRHLIDQVPGIVDKTQDLAVENEYTWADSTDGDIAFRLDAPPTPWLATALWTDTYTIGALDAGLNYLVFRIPHSGDITEWQVERTRGTATHDFHGSGFHRVHASETNYRYYGLPNADHKTGDVFQVQKGTEHWRDNRVSAVTSA